jgi:hypothetical protein
VVQVVAQATVLIRRVLLVAVLVVSCQALLHCMVARSTVSPLVQEALLLLALP